MDTLTPSPSSLLTHHGRYSVTAPRYGHPHALALLPPHTPRSLFGNGSSPWTPPPPRPPPLPHPPRSQLVNGLSSQTPSLTPRSIGKASGSDIPTARTRTRTGYPPCIDTDTTVA
ncbi:hypothetical protein C8R44DRAFT_867485 [Mycena epipterygia]|nr:hypothetical protein C8R44DRAFT_867485 [Mycena epipterygia]